MLEDMLWACVLDLKGSWEEHFPLVEFAYNNSCQASIHMAPYEDLYGRPCRSPVCWIEVGERITIGPELVRDTFEKVEWIWKHLLTAQSRQKSYAERRRRPLEYEVGDHVFLKVMPKRGVVRFGKWGKLSPRYIGPFEVLERVGPVGLTAKLIECTYSILCLHAQEVHPGSDHVVDWEELVVNVDGTFEEGPMRIMDSRDQVLRSKTMRLVKVLWQHRGIKEATWELEDTTTTRK